MYAIFMFLFLNVNLLGHLWCFAGSARIHWDNLTYCLLLLTCLTVACEVLIIHSDSVLVNVML